MVDTKLIQGGLLIAVILLAAFGGNVRLTDDQLEKAYVCPLNENVYLFDRLSVSGKTGYYMEDGVEKSIACRSGNTYAIYIKAREYCLANGCNPMDLVEFRVEPVADVVILTPSVSGVSEICCHTSPKVCTPGRCIE